MRSWRRTSLGVGLALPSPRSSVADLNEALRAPSDDGNGLVPATAGDAGGAGVIHLRARLRALEGGLEIESLPGRGTTIGAGGSARGAPAPRRRAEA